MTSSGLKNEETAEKEVTSKEQEQFLARVKQAEELAERSPSSYKLKVVLWALIGYLYMFIVPIGLGLAIVLIILLASKISLGFIAGLKPLIAATCIAFGCYVKALWVRFEPPKGNELTRGEFPELFAFIDSLTKKTGVKVDHVLLTREMNAAVVQYPKFGLFGFYENYLFIGLSLMLALSEKEFQSVLAHELGHLANHHSKRSAWIYSMRTRWSQIMTALDANSSFLLVFMMRFLDWYQPRFLTLTQVIARRQEREADQLAIEIAGAEAHARSFLVITAREKLLSDNAIEEIYRSYPLETKPPADLYNKVADALGAEITDRKKLTENIEAIFTTEQHPFDTHPADCERIRSSSRVTALDGLSKKEKSEKLIEEFELAAAIKRNAAQTIFGANYQKALDLTNREWQADVAEGWARRTEEMLKVSSRRDELKSKLEAGLELSLDEKVEQANAIEILEGLDVALPYFEAIYEENAEEPVSAFTIGAHLLISKYDLSGLPLLEKTAQAGKAYCVKACQVLLYHFEKTKEQKNIEKYSNLLFKYYEEGLQYQQERAAVSITDHFFAHTADQAEVDKLVKTLSQFSEIRAAYLLEKTVQIEKADRMFLVLLRVKLDPGPFATEKRGIAAQELVTKIAESGEFPGACYIQVITGKKDPYLKIIAQHDNALIYGEHPKN